MRMPEPYDGYLVERPGGGFKVEANGVVVKEHEADRDRALALLSEHAGNKPKWLFRLNGSTEPL